MWKLDFKIVTTLAHLVISSPLTKYTCNQLFWNEQYLLWRKWRPSTRPDPTIFTNLVASDHLIVTLRMRRISSSWLRSTTTKCHGYSRILLQKIPTGYFSSYTITADQSTVVDTSFAEANLWSDFFNTSWGISFSHWKKIGEFNHDRFLRKTLSFLPLCTV
jgi:hypothetical protein